MVQYKAVSAGLFLGAVLVLLALAIRYRRQVIGTVRTFFTEPGTAFNLAVFRLVFYATALAVAGVPLHTAERFAALPRGLMVPPTGFSLVASSFPISVTLVQIAFWSALVASIFAALGLFTRVASIVFLVAVTYYLTIPEIFGKVVHYHTIVWVAALLAVSRTADVMSLDAIVRPRRSRSATIETPAPSLAYFLPIKLTWLMLAVSYLGPGLWKYRSAGLDWASASNMRAILYDKWYELGGYRPFLPVDRSGLLLTLGGLMTLCFELGFILLIWHRYTRLLAAAMGLFFHAINIVTLNIKFYWAMILYVTFVDWEWLSRRILQRREPLVFAFDGGCGTCRQTAAALSTATLPGGVRYVSAQDLAAEGGLPKGVDLAELLTDLHVLAPRGNHRGFAAYRRVAWRVPLLWPALPLLYLPPLTSLADRVYRGVADHRLCHAAEGPPTGNRSPAPVRRGWVTAPAVVGAIILAAMLAAIPTGNTNGWPVALYPTFAGLHQPRSERLLVDVRSNSGARSTVALRSCFSWMPTDRYQGLVRQTVARARDGDADDLLVRELVTVAARDCPQLHSAEGFAFYSDEVDTTPNEVGRQVGRKLLLRWTDST